MRMQRWAERSELKQQLVPFGAGHGGPVLLKDDRPYVFDSEAHTLALGVTGMGKTSAFSIPLVLSNIAAGENGVIMDPKGEIYRITAAQAEEAGYRTVFIDLRNPASSMGYSVFREAYRLCRSKDAAERDRAAGMLYSIAHVLFEDCPHDQFWPDSARSLFIGVCLLLFEKRDIRDISFNTAHAVASDKEGLSLLYETLDKDSPARLQLSAYLKAANDTRASIFAVFADGISKITRSNALAGMITDPDGFRLTDITGNEKTLIYVTIPDENRMYGTLGAVIIEQISEYLIHLAHSFDDAKLPIRWHFLLEELGTLSQSFPQLPTMMIAARSRNIRMHLVLQSLSSLTKPYGPDADTILANIGLAIVFRVFDYQTAVSFAQRVGMRQVDDGRGVRTEALLTPNDILGFPQFQALVIVDGSLHAVLKLCRYDVLFDRSDWPAPKRPEAPTEGVDHDRNPHVADAKTILSELLAKMDSAQLMVFKEAAE